MKNNLIDVLFFIGQYWGLLSAVPPSACNGDNITSARLHGNVPVPHALTTELRDLSSQNKLLYSILNMDQRMTIASVEK